jgi:CRP-like cAMP-binding protein
MSTSQSSSDALLQQTRNLLQAHPVRGVCAEDLVRVLAASKMRRMSGGEVLCSEGDPGDSMYFLLDGAIQVTRTDPHGRVRELALVESPAIVGHMALIDNSPRSATCTAKIRTIVASLDRRLWNRLLSEPSERGTALRRVICASLTRQLAGANSSIRTLIEGPAATRRRADSSSKDLGHKVAPKPTARANHPDTVEDFDASESDLLRVAGVLDGWRIDRTSLRGVDRMQHVFTDDQKRNRKNQ